MRPARFIFPPIDRDGVCRAQQSNGSALIINGALLDLAETTYGIARVVLPGIERTITLFSESDLSAIAFTFVGKNVERESIGETLLGPTAGATVQTALQYAEIDSVTPGAAVEFDVEVGTGPVGTTNWMMLDQFKNPAETALYLAMTSAITVSVEATSDNVQIDTSPSLFILPDFSGLTASKIGKTDMAASAVRAIVTNSSGDGAMEFTVLQPG